MENKPPLLPSLATFTKTEVRDSMGLEGFAHPNNQNFCTEDFKRFLFNA